MIYTHIDGTAFIRPLKALFGYLFFLNPSSQIIKLFAGQETRKYSQGFETAGGINSHVQL